MTPPKKNKLFLRILALIAAIILWFIVITVENSVYALPDAIEVQTLNLGKNLSLNSGLPQVKLFVGVEKDSVTSITPNDFEIYVDLENVEAGEHTLPIIAESNNEKARVLKIEPAEVKLKISPLAKKDVEVIVKVKGLPDPNYKVAETKAEFKKATITGAQEVLDRISSVEVELVLDGTQTGNVSQNGALKLPPDQLTSEDIVTINPEELQVTATIVSAVEKKMVNVVLGFNRESDRSIWEPRVVVSPSRVEIQGRETDLKNISEIIALPFEISALNRNGFIETGLALPQGVSTVVPDQKIKVALIKSAAPEDDFVNE